MGDVTDHDVMTRMDAMRRLYAAINPNAYVGEMQMVARQVILAWEAEREGLMPQGEVLDKLVQEFLNEELPNNPSRRNVDALEDSKGSGNEVTLDELRRFVAEKEATSALSTRNISAPAVPLNAANETFATAFSQMDTTLEGEKIRADLVILSAKALLVEVADDDPEIQTTYDELRAARFVTPAVAVLSVARADQTALAEKAAISDEDIKKYYDENKHEFMKPIDAEEAEDGKIPEPEFKSLESVTDDIKKKLATQAAETRAKAMMIAFEQSIQDLGLEEADAEAFKKAATAAELVVDSFDVREKTEGTLAIGSFGDLKQKERDIGLFTQKLGFISGLTQTTAEPPTWMLFRLDDKREAGAKDLNDPDVKKEVKERIAGKRAYKQLLTEAEAIRAAAEKSGPGGLRAWFDTEEAKKWNAKVIPQSYAPLTELRPPADEQGIVTGEGRLAISMALPSAPVILVNADKTDEDIPSLKIVQGVDAKSAAELSPEQRARLAESYRGSIERHRQSLYWNEISSKFSN
jgi:hypothetical protein